MTNVCFLIQNKPNNNRINLYVDQQDFTSMQKDCGKKWEYLDTGN